MDVVDDRHSEMINQGTRRDNDVSVSYCWKVPWRPCP